MVCNSVEGLMLAGRSDRSFWTGTVPAAFAGVAI